MNFYLRPLFAACLVAATITTPLLAQEGKEKAEAKKPVSRWAKAMAEFENQDKKPNAKSSWMVFTGSSSIRLWDLEKSFPNADPLPLNRGFGGSQVSDAIEHAETLVIKHKPRVVVFYSGDNDIAAGKKPERVIKDYKTFVDKIHKDLPKTEIVILAIKPCPSRWKYAEKNQQVNKGVAEFCKKTKHTRFVDIWEPMLGKDGELQESLYRKDKLHLSEEGYELWNKVLKPHLTQAIKDSVGYKGKE